MTKANTNRPKPDHHRLLRAGAALLIMSQVVEACTGTPVMTTTPIAALGIVFASLFVLAEIIEVLDGSGPLVRRVSWKVMRALRRHGSSHKPPPAATQ
jgi:hypothetical protein